LFISDQPVTAFRARNVRTALAKGSGEAERTQYHIVRYREIGKHCPGVDSIATFFGVPAWYLLVSDEHPELLCIVVAYLTVKRLKSGSEYVFDSSGRSNA
jgi:hypothetical protein